MSEAGTPRQPGPATSTSLKVIRRLEIVGPGNVRSEFELNRPHALIGRAEGCDLRLEQPEVSSRHAYLQVISGQIACVDLSSRTPVLWSEGPREVGWLTLGTQVKIGPYTIRLIDDGRGNRDDLSNFPLGCNPLLPDPQEFGPLPHVSLEWLIVGADRSPYRVKRLITVVGRDPRCQLRLNDHSVSRVHCSLVLTQRRFWVIDLLGRGGTRVNEAFIERCTPNSGDELAVGNFRMRIQLGQSPQAGPGSSIVMSAAKRRQHHAEAGQTPRAAAAPQTVAGFGTVFRVDAAASTLIVAPLADRVHQNCADVQRELRLLGRQIAQAAATNVVIDLGQIEYAGSEVIGMVVSVCKQACDRGGKAAICNAEYRMHHVLGTMHLFDLWPYFETPEAALRFVEKDADRAAQHVLIESDTDPALGIATQRIDHAWLGTLFAVCHQNTTLIVEPLVKGHAFEYAKLHTESNALRRQLDHPDVHQLVLDLGQLDYLGSEVIGVIVSLARKITDRGGKAVLCNVSDKLRQPLRRMHLDKLWPIVESREDAQR